MSAPRLVLVGGGSFIARHVAQTAARHKSEVVSLRHDAQLSRALRSSDTVINFSLSPAYRVEPYSIEHDCDLRAALACRDSGATFVMLSTRRVYPAEWRWGAKETDPSGGDETQYGQNKSRTESEIGEALGSNSAILRLSNVFGFEYDPTGARRTFFAQALTSLKTRKKIVLDMHPDTKRDFLPVEECAEAIVDCAIGRMSGIYNIGSGFAVTCGNVAQWILAGYGDGAIELLSETVRDEFYLDMGKWQSRFQKLITGDELTIRCTELGRSLR